MKNTIESGISTLALQGPPKIKVMTGESTVAIKQETSNVLAQGTPEKPQLMVYFGKLGQSTAT